MVRTIVREMFVWRLGAVQVDLESGSVRLASGERLGLTGQELGVLHALLAAEGRVCDRDTLLPGASARRVDRVLFALRRKLERDPKNPEHLLSVYGQGYRLALDAAGPETPLLGRASAFAYLALEPQAAVWGPPGAGLSAVAQTLQRPLGPAAGALTLGGVDPEVAQGLLQRQAGRSLGHAADLCTLVGHLPGVCRELGARARLMDEQALLRGLSEHVREWLPAWWSECQARMEATGGDSELSVLACCARHRLPVEQAAQLLGGRSAVERLHRWGFVSWEPPDTLHLPLPFWRLSRDGLASEHWQQWRAWLDQRVETLRVGVHGPQGGACVAELDGLRPEVEQLVRSHPEHRGLAVRLVVALDTACRRLGLEGWLSEMHEILLQHTGDLTSLEASELWQVRSEWLRLRGALRRADEAAQAGVTHARQPGGEAALCMAMGQLAVVHQTRSLWGPAEQAYQEALDHCRDPRVAASMLANLAHVQLRLGRDREGQNTLLQLIQQHVREGEPSREIRPRGTLARHLIEIGALQRAEDQLRIVEALLLDSPTSFQHAQHALRWGLLQVEQRTFALARGSFERAIGYAQEVEEPRTQALAVGYLGLIAFLEGDLELAAERLQASMEGHAKAGRTRFGAYACSWLAWVALEQGRRKTAKEHLIQARRWGTAPDLVLAMELAELRSVGEALPVDKLAQLKRAARRNWEVRLALRRLTGR